MADSSTQELQFSELATQVKLSARPPFPANLNPRNQTTPMKHPHPLILSKSAKDRAIVDSLFNPINGQTLACVESERFDCGKYRNSLVGRPIPEHMLSRVALVWSEPRRDSDGPYHALFCLPMPKEIEAVGSADCLES